MIQKVSDVSCGVSVGLWLCPGTWGQLILGQGLVQMAPVPPRDVPHPFRDIPAPPLLQKGLISDGIMRSWAHWWADIMSWEGEEQCRARLQPWQCHSPAAHGHSSYMAHRDLHLRKKAFLFWSLPEMELFLCRESCWHSQQSPWHVVLFAHAYVGVWAPCRLVLLPRACTSLRSWHLPGPKKAELTQVRWEPTMGRVNFTSRLWVVVFPCCRWWWWCSSHWNSAGMAPGWGRTRLEWELNKEWEKLRLNIPKHTLSTCWLHQHLPCCCWRCPSLLHQCSRGSASSGISQNHWTLSTFNNLLLLMHSVRPIT